MDAPRIVVIGSANMDLIVQADRIPAPGETVLGGRFVMAPGGKGANQAAAAARLGGNVTFVTRLGMDSQGEALAKALTEAGVRPDFLLRDPDTPSGVALIGVDAQGQNAIMVAPGANARLSPADVESARDAIAQAAWIVLQLEIPLPTVLHAVSVAHAFGTRVLLNPAPMQVLPPELLARLDVLTPNKYEAAQLLGYSTGEFDRFQGEDLDAVARKLHERGVQALVITLGEEGCLLSDAAGIRKIPALSVTAVDTTAAGDCFSGALAVALGEGQTLDQAAQFASRAAALSVTRLGALPSLPTRAEVEKFTGPV